ncbi:hypothetical protein NPIL_570711 [Nephila pilipes]|uniref:Uncharacterized protein n=1 Tax=Nephila pilipes TaxID=299642 RepID=A0A8X6MSG2_NEPPI|nr:hypothetical protein NPIL_570711 [Nephila pilipes]
MGHDVHFSSPVRPLNIQEMARVDGCIPLSPEVPIERVIGAKLTRDCKMSYRHINRPYNRFSWRLIVVVTVTQASKSPSQGQALFLSDRGSELKTHRVRKLMDVESSVPNYPLAWYDWRVHLGFLHC